MEGREFTLKRRRLSAEIPPILTTPGLAEHGERLQHLAHLAGVRPLEAAGELGGPGGAGGEQGAQRDVSLGVARGPRRQAGILAWCDRDLDILGAAGFGV